MMHTVNQSMSKFRTEKQKYIRCFNKKKFNELLDAYKNTGRAKRVRGKSMTTREIWNWHTNSPEAKSSRRVEQLWSGFKDESKRNHYTTYLQIISSVVGKIKGTQIEEVKLHLFADHNYVRRKS